MSRRGRPLSAARRDLARVLDRLRAGECHGTIAASYAVDRSTIHRIAAEHGFRARAGRRGAWPECPAALLADYRWLNRRKNIPAAEARAMLEREAAA